MKRVTFFTKSECTLCRGALFVIQRIEGCEVTTIARETGATPDVSPLLAKHFAEVFGA